MLFDDFINKWKGKGIDFDGAYGDQCMDLMHQYIVEVLGKTDGRILAAPAAKDVYLNFANVFGHEYFDKIDNTPTGVPQKGDIIFWGTGIGQYGHVAIFHDGDVNKFNSFDQNWNGHQYCETISHPYTSVLGWLRFKGIPDSVSPDIYKGYDLTNKDSMKVAVDVLVRVQQGEFVEKTKADADLKAKQDTIDNLNQQINDRNNDIVSLNSQISTLNQQVLDLTTQRDNALEQAKVIPDLKKENEALTDKVKAYQEAEKTWNRVRGQLQSQIDDLKKNSFQALVKSILEKLFGK